MRSRNILNFNLLYKGKMFINQYRTFQCMLGERPVA